MPTLPPGSPEQGCSGLRAPRSQTRTDLSSEAIRLCRAVQQWRGDDHEQQVLNHVHPEQLARKHLDRALERKKNRGEAQPECRDSPAAGPVLRRAAYPTDHVEHRRNRDADEDGRLKGPVGEGRP